ncbi:MAG: diaminopropionate ammonia-lyase [Kangiellaceae bacterium]|nr:diaminopropionate ammonia-lyase [Kangiellaceae bacterium]
MKKIGHLLNPYNPMLDKHRINKDAAVSPIFTQKILEQVKCFHQSLPNYKPTPLIKLKSLSAKLGLSDILVKDESQRFELNAFKMLGASFAIASYLAKYLHLEQTYFTYEQIIKRRNEYQDIIFATATDGNHGRAVAWSAKLFGCHSRIFMPKGSSDVRLNAIKKYTTEAEITEMNYDLTVNYVAQRSKDNNWQLIQDTAWPGYTEIPNNIMRGYFSLLSEFELQSKGLWPTHVFLQAGVGSMAAAITEYLVAHEKPTPSIILIEPINAPCFYESIKINDGLAHPFGDLKTIMAGLACGVPSMSAWETLSQHCSAFLVCEDEITMDGMRRYANPVDSDQMIISGESGAVSLGCLESIMSKPEHSEIKRALGLNNRSPVLLLSTEGDTDPDFYAKTISGQL